MKEGGIMRRKMGENEKSENSSNKNLSVSTGLNSRTLFN
jgi:hypothetical protein